MLYHYALMVDAGLIVASLSPEIGVPESVQVHRLIWAGQDFLDATRDSKVWKLAKEKVLKPGASWTFSLLVEWLNQEAHKKIFGTPASSSKQSVFHLWYKVLAVFPGARRSRRFPVRIKITASIAFAR